MTAHKDDMIPIIVYSSLLILAIMILFLVDLHDEPTKSEVKGAASVSSIYAVDDTCTIRDGNDTAYFVYLWDDTDMQCMQYSVPDAVTFAALKKMTGYGIEINNYGQQRCFWNNVCLTNGTPIIDYFSKSKT